jgi:hypothetical protein
LAGNRSNAVPVGKDQSFYFNCTDQIKVISPFFNQSLARISGTLSDVPDGFADSWQAFGYSRRLPRSSGKLSGIPDAFPELRATNRE